MTFELQLETSLLLELDLSFSMLIKPPAAKLAKHLYIGSNWTDEIEPGLLNEASSLRNNSFAEFSKIFAWKSPYKEDIQQYIDWLKGLSVSEMYHILSPLMDEEHSFPFDIENLRTLYASVLEKWYKGYFIKMEEDYLEKFKSYFENIERLRHEEVNKEQFLEDLTEGVIIDPASTIKTVVLFPSLYHRPISTCCVFSSISFASFSPQFENDRDYDLEWITNFGKAISDDIRMKMIEILSKRKVTFSELTKEVGTTKANIHHHLLILRVAKLLRMYDTGDKNSFGYYSLRPDIIKTASMILGKKLL